MLQENKDIYVSQESLYGKYLHKEIKINDEEDGAQEKHDTDLKPWI